MRTKLVTMLVRTRDDYTRRSIVHQGFDDAQWLALIAEQYYQNRPHLPRRHMHVEVCPMPEWGKGE